MYGVETIIIPAAALIEELSFDLAIAASRQGPTIDVLDWAGSLQPDYSDNRKAAFGFLDLAIRPPGNCDVILQYAVPTFPIAEPPVLAWTNGPTLIAAAAGAWSEVQRRRITGRFSRIQITNTAGVANNGIYLVYFVRSV